MLERPRRQAYGAGTVELRPIRQSVHLLSVMTPSGFRGSMLNVQIGVWKNEHDVIAGAVAI